MASIKFYLNRPDSKEKTAIFFRLSYGAYEITKGKRQYLSIRYFISESISPEFWDTKNGRAKETRKFPQYPEFNQRLKEIENTVLNVLRRIQNDGIEPENDILKREFDKIWRSGKNLTEDEAAGMEFIQYVHHFIKTSNKRESTKKSYRVVERDLKEYQSRKKTKLKFASIDIDFYNSFVKFLKSKRYAPNTIGTRVKNLKTFLSNAKEAGLPVTEDFKKRAFAKLKEETESIYLSEQELMDMYNIDLNKFPKLSRTRDLFLIGAYTGLRFSDLSKLNEDNISIQEQLISIRTVKTDKPVVIPFHPIVRAILNKYEYHLPKIPSNQKFNEYLKEVARLAGIIEPVRIEQTKGDFKIKKSEPKYNLVSSHTARRSFATNTYLRDVPSISIMKITGHKTESAFMKYIKISQEDNARKLQMHNFFSPITIAN